MANRQFLFTVRAINTSHGWEYEAAHDTEINGVGIVKAIDETPVDAIKRCCDHMRASLLTEMAKTWHDINHASGGLDD